MSKLWLPQTTQKLIVDSETKMQASEVDYGLPGETGDVGATGPTGNGTGYVLSTTVTSTLDPLDDRLDDLLNNVGNWNTFTMINGWSAYGAGFESPRYRKVDYWVQLQGLAGIASAPGNDTMCLLPVGWRPVGNALFMVHTGEPHTWGRIDISPSSGAITRINGNFNYMSLTGIQFSTI